MPYKEYTPKFTSDQPMPGIQCPICVKGFIESNDFTDKKGVRWFSVKCESCLTKWLSKFPPKKIEVQRQGEEFHEEVKKVEHNWEVEIIGRLDKLSERLTEMAKFLDKRLPPLE